MQFIVLLHFPFLKNCGTKDLTQGLRHAKPVLLQNHTSNPKQLCVFM